MSNAGWFPDPAGQPGHFRYWDGTQWSNETTTTPEHTPAPGTQRRDAGGPPRDPGRFTHGQHPSGSTEATAAPGGGRRWPLIAGVVVVLLLLIGGAVWLFSTISGGGGTATPGGGNQTQDVCPHDDSPLESRTPQPQDGRVHGGQLSYPRLGSPWSAPKPEDRIAFGRDAVRQDIVIETDPTWLAGVFVADLVAGDGFYGPEQGAEVVLDCITGTFYGDTAVTRDDQRSEALTVDGREAWIVETWLGFDVPGVEAKREFVILVIVETEPGAAAVYFASIPENAEQYIAPAQELVSQLQVR